MQSKERTRILHINNTAGVASVLARMLDTNAGTESSVITRKSRDPVGLTYYGKAYDDGSTHFYLRALWMARKFDIIHVYALDKMVVWLKRIYPRKPVALYYLGSDIRGRWKEREKAWSRADFVGYTTDDLSVGAPEGAKQMFCPIDTETFSPSKAEKKPGEAVSVRYGMDKEAAEMAERMSLNLTMVDHDSVPYPKMPALLASYEYYLDMRRPKGRNKPVECLGKTALEALACGSKAIDWSGRVYDELPLENRPESVVPKWMEVYRRILKGKATT